MARIVFSSVAYLGDVAPLITPANVLADRGHDVTFLAPAGFSDVLAGEKFSVATYPLDFSVRRMNADPKYQKLMRHPFANQLRLTRYWNEIAFCSDPVVAMEALLATLKGADALVTHPTFGSVSIPAAKSLGVPSVAMQLFPMMIPTASHTTALGKDTRNFGRPLNRAMWWFTTVGSGALMNDGLINDYRRDLGLPPRRGNLLTGWTEADHTVVLLSRNYVGAPPPDWPEMTWAGFSHWAGPPAMRDAPLDPRIEEFLAAGDPPVLITLGTSAAADAGDAFAKIASDLDQLGLRSLFVVSHEDNLPALRGRDGVFVFAPLAKLLPRVRAAVVSGAVGTLAAALAAGVPVVVLPQLFDQVWHGGQVERLGVGRMAWRAGGVAKAVAAIEANPAYRLRANELAAAMADEDGPGVLADVVESATLSG